MVHIIVKIDNWYYIWSTITDAFYTSAMNYKELQTYCLQVEHDSEFEFSKRMERVEKYGTSWITPTRMQCYFEEVEK